MSIRYNLRRRPPGTEVLSAAQPLRPGSPLTGTESPTSGVSPGTERGVPASGSQSSAIVAGLASCVNQRLFNTGEGVRKYPVTIEDGSNDDGGPWIPVQRRRRARSADAALPARDPVTAQDGPILTSPQRAAVDTAAASLTSVKRDRYSHRMAAVEMTRPRSLSPKHRSEGPSWDKGKTVDAWNWGASGIPDNELDPNAQRHELQLYSTGHHNIFDNYDTDEQRAMLEYWEARKQGRKDSEREPTAVTTPGGSTQSGSSYTTSRASTPSEASEVEEAIMAAPRRSASQEANRLLTEQLQEIRKELARLKEEAEQHKAARKKKRDLQNARKAKGAVISQESVARRKSLGPVHRASSLQPVAQLEPGSYLEWAFAGITGGDPSDSSDGSSSSSSEPSELAQGLV
ncbi:hypothetical protein DICSQDRAFT_172304 [Dichomitus squalens LYAD-421 SS1]|uniref:Uncharacterized protein n=1 Tax=Dichomitus squalens (strain LYAD-421) TaxID=732165 RepID=R7SSI3_DICSQ|nr:uncharacterized protein DICSQDRAFT_172304 [Dichomitus squalens LYAD-421 SS1]EJF59154.1 hypothetical protein DICSQDRAFT_172304 [Dichomitus squalens LYAD-421 SS1]